MRIIKFRGKDIKTGKWAYGDLIQLQSSTHIHQTENGCRVAYEVYEKTIGEFTGLKDKNNKGIYEGDIFKESHSIGIIVYNEDGFEIKWHEDNDFYNNVLKIHHNHLEIIGNIYENSDLLK